MLIQAANIFWGLCATAYSGSPEKSDIWQMEKTNSSFGALSLFNRKFMDNMLVND